MVAKGGRANQALGRRRGVKQGAGDPLQGELAGRGADGRKFAPAPRGRENDGIAGPLEADGPPQLLGEFAVSLEPQTRGREKRGVLAITQQELYLVHQLLVVAYELQSS